MRQDGRMPRIDNCVKNALNWLYPAKCAVCRSADTGDLGLCEGCLTDLPRWPQQCPRCAGHGHPDTSCGRCQQTHPAFDVTLAPLVYGPPLDRLLREFKYQRRFRYARVLGQVLRHEIEGRLRQPPEAVVPVPLHASRLRQRGFNQSLELARPIAAALGIPILRHCVERVHNTTPQTRLPLARRRANVNGAFAARLTMTFERVAIVDDVMTSGHTVNDLARCLKRAGVGHVQVWTLARAQPTKT